MTYQDILKLHIPCNFGLEEDNGWSSDLDYVCDQLPANVNYDNGCSKFVIFLNDEEVIKIPFSGMYIYDEDDDEYYFREFEGGDYCKKEAEVYQAAAQEGLAFFFAKTMLAGFTEEDKYPIYISDRVCPFNDDPSRRNSFSDESYKKAREYHSSFSPSWLACALEYYGEKDVERLVAFVKRERVGDFHLGNLGFTQDGAPIIFDYSGYMENS